MANTFDVSTSNLDSTFVLETNEEVKQPKKEKESPKMLDSIDSNNNNSPKVLATKSNLPVPTMRVLRSTPKKNIFPPETRGSQAKQETNGSAVANEEYSFQLGDPVWAKMKGFSAWPGKIEMPPENIKRPITKKVMHCVFFFGSYDYEWLPEADLKPYQKFKTKSEMSTTKKSVKKAEAKLGYSEAIDEIEAYIEGGCKTNAATIVAMSKGAVVMPVIIDQSAKENLLLDEVRSLKGELNATKIRCEEMMLKDTHVQIRLSKLLDENTGLKVDNLEHQRKIVLLLQIIEDKDAEIEDQKTQISSPVKTIGAARGGPPKKSRKSVNFKVPPKGAQSLKAMSRLQFNQTKINHRDQDRSLWKNQSVPTNGPSAERARLQKLLPESLRKPKVEKEELRNPAPNIREVTVPATKTSLLRANLIKKNEIGK